MPESKLKVILLRYTPNPEETIAMAAKLCYSASDISLLRGKIESKDQKEFVEKLMIMGHMTPIEHPSFTFAIEGISRACSHQLVRHRLASYSQQSQRYVSEKNGFDYIIPETIKKDKNLNKYFQDFMEEAQKAYNYIIERLNEKGVKGEEANQDARFVLPNAAETKLIATMNARELLHFFRLRCCYRAQWEIRHLAEQMLFLVKPIAPKIFEKAGPACLYAPCPEGKMACKELRNVRKKYGSTYREKKRSRRTPKTTLTGRLSQNRLFQE